MNLNGTIYIKREKKMSPKQHIESKYMFRNISISINSTNFEHLVALAPAERKLGGGGAYSYIRVLPNHFLLKLIVFKVCM